jgi:hypothetical protein
MVEPLTSLAPLVGGDLAVTLRRRANGLVVDRWPFEQFLLGILLWAVP